MENTSNIKVLLVDDRDENLLALETILDNLGYTLVKAHSGKEALKWLLKDQDFYLIIMDVVMPEMDGFETAELIYSREKLKNIPIIFLTALDIEENMYRGYKTGAVDYINKPIVPGLLRAKVGAFVDLSIKNRRLLEQEEKLKAINKSLEKEVEERKLSEEKVKALNNDLKQKLDELQSLDAFAYSVSHDLMSPVNNIKGILNLFIDKYKDQLDEDGMKLIQMIEQSANRMSSLIKDILWFSKQANAELNKTELDMNEVVKSVLQEIALYSSLDKVNFKIGELPRALCDGNMLKQVWVNFISNAVKYSKKKDMPQVDIGCKITNGVPTYYVKDNGVGFDMKKYGKLFSIFQRLHSPKDFEGTGLGLAIVKRIIERHGGRVWAESKVGEGSTFYFSVEEAPVLVEK